MANVGDLDRRYYPDYEDEHARFDRVVRRYLREGMTVLDAGAGRGVRYPYDYARIARRVVGADLNPAIARNANLTDAVVSDLTALPFQDGTFDLAYSKYVFEHLDRPVHVLGELRRVLATGAHLLVLFLSRLLYRAGIAYERTVSHWDALAGLRVQLIADLEAR